MKLLAATLSAVAVVSATNTAARASRSNVATGASTSDDSSSSSRSGGCTALVVGAQGSQQAYVAGAMAGLAKHLSSASSGATHYDVVVSTGASLIAAEAAAVWGPPSLLAAASVAAVTAARGAGDMYTEFKGGEAAGFLGHGGLLNATVSRDAYERILSRPLAGSRRTVVAVATSLSSTLQVPLPVSTSKSEVGKSVDALMASAADPTLFAPQAVNVDGQVDAFVSGAVRSQVNVFEAVGQCRDKGFEDSEITVDVVYTSASQLQERDVSGYNTIGVMLRDENIKKFVAAQQDLLFAKAAYPDVNFRYDVSPDFALLTKPDDYNAISKLAMIARGTADAEAEIARVLSGEECDTSKAPACAEDQDCVVWAANACLSATLPTQGRCLPAATSASSSSSPSMPMGTCSYNATHIAAHRAARVTRSPEDGLCNAVAFSGGGDRGAYEAGVLKGLVDAGADVQYEVVSGVSVGSIVGAALSKFPIGNESDAAGFMVQTALGVTADVIYKNWTKLIPFIGPEGIVRGLLFESGTFDSSGERQFLETQLPEDPLDPSARYRRFSALATNMGTGQGQRFTFTGAPGTKPFIDALMASSAIQGAFPMVEIDGEYYGDGGAIFTIDAYAATEICRELGYDDNSIQIDTISVAGFFQTTVPAAVALQFDTAQTQARVELIQQIDSLMAVIDFYRNAEPKLFRRNTFPSTALPGTGLSFNVDEMQEMVQIGIQDGTTAATSADIDVLPPGCTYQSSTIPCGADKDCFNWAVQMCNSQLSSTMCDHKQRQCIFKV